MNHACYLIAFAIIFSGCPKDKAPKDKAPKDQELIKFIKVRNCKVGSCEIKNIHQSKTIKAFYHKVIAKFGDKVTQSNLGEITLEAGELRVVPCIAKQIGSTEVFECNEIVVYDVNYE